MAIKVLVIDDSVVVRGILTNELGKDPGIQVVGGAPDPLVAADMIESLAPDVLTLDINMPRMDGITFLKGLMRHSPMPVVVVSSLSKKGSKIAMLALELGAVDVVAKPGSGTEVREIIRELITKVKIAARARIGRLRMPTPQKIEPLSLDVDGGRLAKTVIAIGASTGGTQALEAILTRLPANFPGIAMVQHMPLGFTALFAERLNSLTAIEVREARDRDRVVPGLALLAPGNRHMALKRTASHYYVMLQDGPDVHHQKPAVEILFYSVAKAVGSQAIGMILTGMGADGAQGMLAMKKCGAINIAQDEESSVVFGMPAEAIEAGGVDHVISLDQIPARLIQLLQSAAR